MRAMTWPTVTVSPASAEHSVIVPDAGRGDLGVDLVGGDLDERLVGPTASPGCLAHSRIVPSVTDSPMAGMTMSTVSPARLLGLRLVVRGGLGAAAAPSQ